MNGPIIAYRGNMGVQTTPPFTNTYSLSFDGVDDYVDTGIPNLSGTDFCISYWFKTTATDSGSGGNDGTLINGVAYSTDIP